MLIAGVDEAGRGALCGDVFAAAVILNPNAPIMGLDDSKKLSAKKREFLFTEICAKALSYAICCASAQEIDQINILQASLLAMQRAVNALKITPNKVLIDGNKCPKLDVSCEAIIGGDGKIAAIAAASILAKVSRDRAMLEFDAKYPNYGIAKHKGYGTKEHLAALQKFGVLPIHRTSFAPVRACLQIQELKF